MDPSFMPSRKSFERAGKITYQFLVVIPFLSYQAVGCFSIATCYDSIQNRFVGNGTYDLKTASDLSLYSKQTLHYPSKKLCEFRNSTSI
jgi:hypothetical protein